MRNWQKFIIYLSGATILGGSIATLVNAQFLGIDVVNVKSGKGLNVGEDYIITEVLNGRVPKCDIGDGSDPTLALEYADVPKSKTNCGEYYIGALKKLGDDFSDKNEKNLFKRIRNQAEKLK